MAIRKDERSVSIGRKIATTTALAALAVLASLFLCVSLLLAGCGQSVGLGTGIDTSTVTSTSDTDTSTVTSTSGANVTLSCTLQKHLQGMDTIVATVSCQVKGAAVSDSSFALTYTAAGPGSQQRQMRAACSGLLHNGLGICTQTYTLVAPTGSKSGSVAGELLPSHKPLGPVTPLPVPATGTPGPFPIITPSQ